MSDLQQIIQRVTELFDLADRVCQRKFERPVIHIDLRGRTAGQAWPQKQLLRFNMTLFRQHREDFLQQTVAHEVAHLVAYQLYGLSIRPHGHEWQKIMTELFQLPADRCHQYEVPPSSQQKNQWRYQCQCHENILYLSTTRHNRVQKGVRYQCRQCRSELRYVGE